MLKDSEKLYKGYMSTFIFVFQTLFAVFCSNNVLTLYRDKQYYEDTTENGGNTAKVSCLTAIGAFQNDKSQRDT